MREGGRITLGIILRYCSSSALRCILSGSISMRLLAVVGARLQTAGNFGIGFGVLHGG
jgi:hypothetical protein